MNEVDMSDTKGIYMGQEPANIRLLILRTARCIPVLLLIILALTLAFGGGYYIKNIALAEDKGYQAVADFKTEYTDEPSKAGDYYINETTWNTYLQSSEFLTRVYAELDEPKGTPEDLRECISATVASDIHIPTVRVTDGGNEKGFTLTDLTASVEKALVGGFAEDNPQINKIIRLDDWRISHIEPDVRPVRAFALSAVLSVFFVLVIFFMYELSTDGIWLPETVRARYGIKCIGTRAMPEYEENLKQLSREEDIEIFSEEELLSEGVDASKIMGRKLVLSLKAGRGAGGRLERILTLLDARGLSLAAVELTGADEILIKRYYHI